VVDRWWRPELRRRAVDGPTASLDTKINGRRRRRRFNEERRAPIDFSASPNDSPPPPPLPDPPDWITRTALNLRRAISAAAACNLETASSARRGRCAVGRRPPVSRRIVAAAVGKNDGETTEPKSAPTFFSHGRHVYGGHSLDPLRFCFFVIRADVFSGVMLRIAVVPTAMTPASVVRLFLRRRAVFLSGRKRPRAATKFRRIGGGGGDEWRLTATDGVATPTPSVRGGGNASAAPIAIDRRRRRVHLSASR